MNTHEIYLYGMNTYTAALLLCGDYPASNAYAEIREKHFFPGGETAAAATILASLGCKVKMDGNFTGSNTDAPLRKFYSNISVDISRLHCAPDYMGVEEIIIIDKNTRTTFGQFAAYFEDYYERGIIRWNTPREEDIKGIKAAGIDPFFGNEAILAAQYCNKYNVPFVTIDERYDHEVCKLASVIVVSSDWVRNNMPEHNSGDGKLELLKKYMENSSALVVITGGEGTTIYGRKGEIGSVEAHKVDVVSTLGAGDTFKAGCIYGLSQRWSDDEIIRFSMACAAVACTKFPLPFNPPTLAEVLDFMESKR